MHGRVAMVRKSVAASCKYLQHTIVLTASLLLKQQMATVGYLIGESTPTITYGMDVHHTSKFASSRCNSSYLLADAHITY